MRKIPTIFKRDFNKNGAIYDQLTVNVGDLLKATATEKFNGTNVRITIRNREIVRIEKRRNPTRDQKKSGILDPWYVDARVEEPSDKWIIEAAEEFECDIFDSENLISRLCKFPDGEWSCEAIGPNIQGNPYALDSHTLIPFSLIKYNFIDPVPLVFDELKEWIKKQRSRLNHNKGIEGIIWVLKGEYIGKIKLNDFK